MPYKVPQPNGIMVAMFEIFLNGKEISDDYYDMVEEVTYESHASGSDIATIFIKDPYIKIIDDPRIVRGMRIKINGGWASDMSEWLDGYISMVDVEFPDSGDPTITIHCMDESFLLDRVDVKKSYANTTFTQLAEMIGQKYGLKAKGSPTPKIYEELSQNDESDMKFLLRIAEDEELVVKVVKGTITWKPKDDVGKSQDMLVWRDYPFNLASFSLRGVLADKKDEVEKAEINTDNKQVEQGKADASTPRKPLGVDLLVWERQGDKYVRRIYTPPTEGGL